MNNLRRVFSKRSLRDREPKHPNPNEPEPVDAPSTQPAQNESGKPVEGAPKKPKRDKGEQNEAAPDKSKREPREEHKEKKENGDKTAGPKEDSVDGPGKGGDGMSHADGPVRKKVPSNLKSKSRRSRSVERARKAQQQVRFLIPAGSSRSKPDTPIEELSDSRTDLPAPSNAFVVPLRPRGSRTNLVEPGHAPLISERTPVISGTPRLPGPRARRTSSTYGMRDTRSFEPRPPSHRTPPSIPRERTMPRSATSSDRDLRQMHRVSRTGETGREQPTTVEYYTENDRVYRLFIVAQTPEENRGSDTRRANGHVRIHDSGRNEPPAHPEHVGRRRRRHRHGPTGSDAGYPD